MPVTALVSATGRDTQARCPQFVGCGGVPPQPRIIQVSNDALPGNADAQVGSFHHVPGNSRSSGRSHNPALTGFGWRFATTASRCPMMSFHPVCVGVTLASVWHANPPLTSFATSSLPTCSYPQIGALATAQRRYPSGSPRCAPLRESDRLSYSTLSTRYAHGPAS